MCRTTRPRASRSSTSARWSCTTLASCAGPSAARQASRRPVQRFTTLDYTHLLELRVSQFEGDTAGQMLLRGAWRLQPVTGDEVAEHAFRINVPMPPDSSDAKSRVKAMNEALLRLAREISMP